MDLRRLDALVALHFMDFPSIYEEGLSQKEYEERRHYLDICPNYSCDIEAAWEVVDRIKIDYEVKLEWENEMWEFYMENEDMDPSHVSAKTEGAPLAICLAALKAKSVDVGEWEK